MKRNARARLSEERLKVEVVHILSHEGCAKNCKTRAGKVLLSNIVTQLTTDAARNAFIVNKVEELLKEERRIIVMSERRGHLAILEKMFTEKGIKSGLYVGETTKKGIKAREEAKQMPLILATTRMAREGKFEKNFLKQLKFQFI